MITHQIASQLRARPLPWISLCVAGAAGVSLACSSCSVSHAEESSAPEVPIPKPSEINPQVAFGPVEEHAVGKTIVSSARIAFDESRVAHVWSPVTGRVTRIIASLGDHVKPGQPLAVISSPDLGNAMSDWEKAKPAVLQTEKELKRQQELYAAHAGPLRDLEMAQAAHDQAVAEEQRAEAKAKLLMERAGHANSISQSFNLTAPIEGEIVARQINPGTEVQGQYSGGANVELFTIGRVDSVWAYADVYEQDIQRVKLGAPVEFEIVAFPGKTFQGAVDWISSTLDPVTRTAKVRCVLKNADRLLKPEMYATARIETDGHKAIAISRNSLLHLGETTMVVAVDNTSNKYERRPVVVDEEESGDWLPVLHGLKAGDTVVTKGALLVSGALN
jgi:cobalt-zinc-cadmium efflux system membrane fusion protein